MDSNVVADTDRAMEIRPKMQLSGTVSKIKLAGAVVDVGLNKPGVLHISSHQITNKSKGSRMY